ncbi:MAG: hypothetical protein KDB01_05355 [Planctomycetaceae bacterium]|nr:hypothetical protein [Planctomycetaceae bacterium]
MSPGTETLIAEVQTRKGVTIPRRGDYLDALAMCLAYGQRFEEWLEFYEREDYLTHPNPENCIHCDGSTWLIDREAMVLLIWLDKEFAIGLFRSIKHHLFQHPAREHHQADLAATAPGVYGMMFPDVPA